MLSEVPGLLSLSRWWWHRELEVVQLKRHLASWKLVPPWLWLFSSYSIIMLLTSRLAKFRWTQGWHLESLDHAVPQWQNPESDWLPGKLDLSKLKDAQPHREQHGQRKGIHRDIEDLDDVDHENGSFCSHELPGSAPPRYSTWMELRLTISKLSYSFWSWLLANLTTSPCV